MNTEKVSDERFIFLQMKIRDEILLAEIKFQEADKPGEVKKWMKKISDLQKKLC